MSPWNCLVRMFLYKQCNKLHNVCTISSMDLNTKGIELYSVCAVILYNKSKTSDKKFCVDKGQNMVFVDKSSWYNQIFRFVQKAVLSNRMSCLNPGNITVFNFLMSHSE